MKYYLFFVALPWALAEEVEIRDVGADKGTNVTIPCGGTLTLPSPNVQWVHRGNKTHHEVLVSATFIKKNTIISHEKCALWCVI